MSTPKKQKSREDSLQEKISPLFTLQSTQYWSQIPQVLFLSKFPPSSEAILPTSSSSRKDKCNLFVTHSRTLSCSSCSLYYHQLLESRDFCMAMLFPLQALAEEQSNSDQILQNLLRRLSEPQPAGFPAALRPALLPLQSVGLLPRL